jgi:beta-xylosidase
VQAFFPGEEGGGALAGVLSGRVNPSGKLPVEVPRHPGGQPHTYLAPPLGHDTSLGHRPQGVSNLDPTPAFPFGHGLSYASFNYENLRASTDEVDTAGGVELTVTVRNTGDRDGAEVVQLYAADPVASVTRPVTQLIGFAPPKRTSSASDSGPSVGGLAICLERRLGRCWPRWKRYAGCQSLGRTASLSTTTT